MKDWPKSFLEVVLTYQIITLLNSVFPTLDGMRQGRGLESGVSLSAVMLGSDKISTV